MRVVATAAQLPLVTAVVSDAAWALLAASDAGNDVHSSRAVATAAAPALLLIECTSTDG